MDPIFIGLCVYLVLILIVGIISTGRNRTHADFLLADRQLGPFAIALSERASAESAWIVLGLPGAALIYGYLEIWTVFGCLLGIIFSWLFLAQPLRELAGKYDSLTVPDLIANYFGDRSNLLRISASVIITFFFALYIAAQFSGAGKIINTTFGLPPVTGMILGGGIIILYTILGGFRAVVWTDVLQALIMFSTLVILPIVGFFSLKNASPAALAAESGLSHSVSNLAIVIISGLSWGLGYTGQPHLIIRFLAIRNSSEIKRGRAIAFSWAIPAFLGAFAIGIIGLKIYGRNMFSDPEMLMPYMATHMLPSVVAGILISGAIAAMMSTADSQLILTTSAITEDIIHNVTHRQYSQKQFLMINRIITCVVGLMAFGLALTSQELVFSLVSYAWSGLGASFGPVLIGIIFWKRITKAGALAGMWTGALSTIIWKNIACLNSLMTERLASYGLATAAIVIVSFLTDKKSIRIKSSSN